MGCSHKQYLFAEYLMNRFGVSEQEFIQQFLDHYLSKYGRWTPSMDGRYNYFDVSAAIDSLLMEQNIKRNRYAIRKKEVRREYTTATDLSAFAFCPASYSINKSFEIPKTSNEREIGLGNYFHDQLNLLKKIKDVGVQKIETEYDIEADVFVLDDSCLQEIYSSTLIFNGHSLDTRKIFLNHETNVACVPDYIFQDIKGNNFVVEEKYHFYRDPRKLTYDEKLNYIEPDDIGRQRVLDRKSQIFHINHIIQVLAYIKNIIDYKIDYGYLVYWYYDFKENDENRAVPYLHKVSKKKILFDEYHRKVYNRAVHSLDGFLTSGRLEMRLDKIQPKKCAGCSVTQYCGHKTKKYTELSIPYSTDYLSLDNVEFPEELKKER